MSDSYFKPCLVDLVAIIAEQGKATQSLEREMETQNLQVEKLGAEFFQKERS